MRNFSIHVNGKTVRKGLKDSNLSFPASRHRGRTRIGNLFCPHGPDQLWETNITYIPTESGMTYLMCIRLFLKGRAGTCLIILLAFGPELRKTIHAVSPLFS